MSSKLAPHKRLAEDCGISHEENEQEHNTSNLKLDASVRKHTSDIPHRLIHGETVNDNNHSDEECLASDKSSLVNKKSPSTNSADVEDILLCEDEHEHEDILLCEEKQTKKDSSLQGTSVWKSKQCNFRHSVSSKHNLKSNQYEFTSGSANTDNFDISKDAENNNHMISLLSMKENNAMSQTGKSAFVCGLCSTAHANFHDLVKHMEHHDEDQGSFVCKVCHRSFTKKNILNNHVSKVHKYNLPGHRCDICKMILATKAALGRHKTKRHHIKTVKSQKFPCILNCKYFFDSAGDLRHHLWMRHPDVVREARGCEICGEAFEQASSLAQHKVSHKNDGPFTCDVCKENISDIFNFFQHLNTHKGEKNLHICTICKVHFIQLRTLKLHLTVHNKDKPHMCKVCGSLYSDLVSLREHQATHAGHGPFVTEIFRLSFSDNVCGPGKHAKLEKVQSKFICDHCCATFESAKTLASHVNLHESENLRNSNQPFATSSLKPVAAKVKPFLHVCSACHTVFTEINNFKYHKCLSPKNPPANNISSDRRYKSLQPNEGDEIGRPYKCDLCPAAFTTSGSLTTHNRTHTGERPYTCSLCNGSFIDKSTLTKHMRVHTGERPYKCDVCNAAFTQSGNLLRHMRMLHLDKNRLGKL